MIYLDLWLLLWILLEIRILYLNLKFRKILTMKAYLLKIWLLGKLACPSSIELLVTLLPGIWPGCFLMPR